MHRFVLISITFENFISLQWLTLSLVIQPNCKFTPRSGLIATAVVISTSNETIVERMFQVRVITVSSFPTKQKSTMFFLFFLCLFFFFFFDSIRRCALPRSRSNEIHPFRGHHSICLVNLKAAIPDICSQDRTSGCRVL